MRVTATTVTKLLLLVSSFTFGYSQAVGSIINKSDLPASSFSTNDPGGRRLLRQQQQQQQGPINNEDIDLLVYEAALSGFDDEDDALIALSEEQTHFLAINPDIVSRKNLVDGQASSYFKSIGFPGIDSISGENLKELDAYYFDEVGTLGCSNLLCEIPLLIGLYTIVNVGAAITKALIAKIALVLLAKTGGSSAVIAVMLGVIVVLGTTVLNGLVPIIVHEACCNLDHYI